MAAVVATPIHPSLVRGLRVGHWTDPVGLTGCTVLLFDEPAMASGDVRGGAPGSTDTALLDPWRTVQRIDAVLLTGGSVFGLAAADGIRRWLDERGAGILIGKRIVGKDGPADLEHFMKVINVNLTGTYNTMRLVAGAMVQLDPVNDDGARGVIINAASIAAFEGQIGQVAYSASKGGIVAMTLPAARDLGKLGIRVMAIAPGAVQTPMIGTISQELQDSIAANIPHPSRMAKPDEFAKLALHIVDNDYLNGTVIRLDGAARLAAK